MELSLIIRLNDKLFLRNPEESELGRKILQNSIILIHELGFEAFTFKKLAQKIKTTEAGIYRYFQNKHLLLIYLVDWYWTWQEFRLISLNQNIKNPKLKIKNSISHLSLYTHDDAQSNHINENLLYEIIISEGAKSFLTKNVAQYNKAKLFKPYKDLCARIAGYIIEYNKAYKYPHSMATTIIEQAHSQSFYKINLPSLTNFGKDKDEKRLVAFIEEMVFSTI
jgi:AcrR family transcriptional regulator